MTAVHPDLKYFLGGKLHFYWYCTSSAIPTTSLGMSGGCECKIDSETGRRFWFVSEKLVGGGWGVKASSLYLAAKVTKPMSPNKIALIITDTLSKQELFSN